MPEVYRDLEAGQIRLLRIVKQSDVIQYDLTTVVLSEAKYTALSWVWGEDPNVNIRIQGQDIPIKPNLLALLHRLANCEINYLWTDAICINQSDATEKASQIPLMDEIYSRANEVIIWLGPAGFGTDEAMGEIPRLGERLQSYGQRKLWPAQLIPEGLPGAEDRIWKGFGDLCRRPWWERLWVIQEAALAKRLSIYCGSRSVQWTAFERMIDGLIATDLKNICLGETHAVRQDVSDAFTTIKHIQLYRTTLLKGLRYNLQPLLQMGRLKNCKFHVDRIWGLLGLMTKGAQAHIRDQGWIRYPEQPEDAAAPPNQGDYWETYKKVIKWYLAYDNELLLLSLAPSREHTPQLPSWCGDWSSPQGFFPFGAVPSYHAGHSAEEKRQARVVTVPESDTIMVQGRQVDRVKTVVEGFWTWGQHGRENLGAESEASKLLEWESQCLDISRQVYPDAGDVPPAHWRTLLGNKINDMMAEPAVPDSWIEAYKSWKLFLHTRSSGNEYVERFQGELQNIRTFAGLVEAASKGRKFFSTYAGRIGLGPPDTKPEDLVCVLHSAAPCFILRSKPEHSMRPQEYLVLKESSMVESQGESSSLSAGTDRSQGDKDIPFRGSKGELVGDAYVHSLMAGEGLRLANCGDEMFMLC